MRRISLFFSVLLFPFLLVGLAGNLHAQAVGAPPQVDTRIYDIIEAASVERVEADVRTLAGFGTRNTYSDTISDIRGIGAARRWINAEFEKISAECGGCLEVFYQTIMIPASSRNPEETAVVSVAAIQRGSLYPNRYVILSGDIDSRASGGNDPLTEAQGANDNATGMAAAIEAARLLTKHSFPTTLVYAGLSAEEQGLYGGRKMAEVALEEGWDIVAVLNNDMIGNTEGIDGIKDNTTFRVFSEPVPATDSLSAHRARRT